jgi:tetratricopeptide (TPR) repeat protein
MIANKPKGTSMAHIFGQLALLAAALAYPSPDAVAQAQAAAQSVTVTGQKNASPWFRAESAHFVVFSDTRQEDVFHLLNNLEKLDHVLRIYTRDYYLGRAAGQKITLYYHDGIAGFNDAAANPPAEAVGLYNSCVSGVLGFGVNLQRPVSLGNEQLAKDPLDASLSHIFEAYARHFLYRYTDIRTPAWYIEGFAQYFSSARFSDSQMALGRPPIDVVRYLRFADHGNRGGLDYEDVFAAAPAKDRGFGAQAGEHLARIARSWNLMHYMLSTDENRARLDRYLELAQREAPAAAVLEEALGLKSSSISSTLWRYRIKGIEVAQVDLPSLPKAQIRFSALPDAATGFVAADAALKSCPGRKDGESLLRTISEQVGGGANNAFARLTLSRAQIDWGKPEDALPFLDEAVRKDPAHAEALYLLGLANLRLHERRQDAPKGGALQVATQHLARARTLNPASAEAAFALYQAGLAGKEPPGQAVLDSAIAAWKNAREANILARSAALAYAYSGRAAEADNALTLLARNAGDPALAGWAKTWQGRLAKGVTRGELLAEMRRDPGLPAAFREWTLDGEDLMKTVEYNAGVEQSIRAIDQLRMADPVGERVYSTPMKR